MFDVIVDREGRRTWVLVADASSKGSLGFFHAELIRDAFRLAVEERCAPAAIVERLNGLHFDVANKDTPVSFASALVASIPFVGDGLCYASAGHDIGLLLNGRAHRHFVPTGPVLGIIREYCYSQTTLPLGPDALLLLATDGITEARCFAEPSRQFGTLGLVRAVLDRIVHGRIRAEDVCASVDAFTNKVYRDDATLAIIETGTVQT